MKDEDNLSGTRMLSRRPLTPQENLTIFLLLSQTNTDVIAGKPDNKIVKSCLKYFDELAATNPYCALITTAQNIDDVAKSHPYVSAAILKEWIKVFEQEAPSDRELARYVAETTYRSCIASRYGFLGMRLYLEEQLPKLGTKYIITTLNLKSRVGPYMNANTAIVALSDGLYDSMVALRETAIEATLLDAHTISDNGMDISTLHTADEMKLYGEKADIFLNWVCQGDPARAAAMVRGFELKLYTLDALQADLVPGDSALLNPDKICLQVQEKIRGYMQVVPAPPEAKIAALKLPFAKPRN